jgi:DNA-binding response OmpR family regulator
MRILIVDVNKEHCEKMAEGLLATGHSVRTAYNTSEAIVIVNEHEPEKILLDVTAPGLPLEQFTSAVRNHHPECKIIMAAGPVTLTERALTLKADDSIRKPYSLADLLKNWALSRKGAAAGLWLNPKHDN